MCEEIDHHRRRFLGTVAMTFAAAELLMAGAAEAQTKSAGLPTGTGPGLRLGPENAERGARP